MASSKIKGINIKIGADTKGLDTALSDIESAGKKASSELREVNSSLKNNNDSVILWKQKQELLTTAIEESRKKLKFLESAQEQIKRQFENNEIDSGQYRAFQREIENTRTETNRLEGQLEQANQRVEELGDGLEHSGQQAENSANGGYTVLGNVFANVITKGIEVAWTTLKNFTKDVVATGTEYESAISNVVAISGAMAEEVEMLQAKAEEMGATTKFTAAESAEAMGYMAMAGWKVDDMVSGLEGIMDLSAASGESLASVSDIVTDALTAFGLQASDSAHFADVLAAASSNANTNVAMMGETFKYAAPLAGTLKYSIEDMALATGLMANSGIKASQAGTTLNSALSRMAKPTKDMKGYMRDLGLVTMQTFDQSADPKAIDKAMRIIEDRTLSAENAQIKLNQAIEKYGENSAQALTATNNLTKAQNSLEEAQEALADLQNGETVSIIDKNLLLTDENGNLKSLRETIETLKEAFSGLSEVQQAEAASALFGKSSMAGMLSIVNARTEDYNKLAEAIDNADGTAKGMASTMMDNLQGDKTLLDSAFDGMKIAISKELNPALRDIVQYATAQMPKIQKAIEPVADFVVNAVKNVPKLVEKVQKFIPILTSIGTAISILGVNQLANNLIQKLIPAVNAVFTILSSNPLLAVTMAVGALTAGVMNYLDAQLDVKSESELLIEKHNEEIQALYDKRRAIKDLNDAFYENVDGIQNQTDRTRDLWNELDKLADQYGNVQDKDRARAEYILNELNSALGTEYSMTGNQIENYKQLSAEIDNVIAKKQAEMMLDAYLSNSTEMTEQRNTARSDYEKYDKELKEKQKAFENAKKQYEEITGTSWETNTREVDKDTAYKIIEDEAETFWGKNSQEYSDYVNAAKTLWNAQNERTQALSLRNEAEKAYQATSEYFDNLEQLQEAYSLGQYDRMAEIIYAEKDLTSTTLDESATDAEQRLEIYSNNLQKTLSDFELAVKSMKQQSVDELEKTFKETMQSGALTDVDPLETWGKFKDNVLEFQKNGLDISPIINGLIDSGITPSQAFDNWQEVFRTQLKNGGDMNAMLQWMNNSGYYNNISTVFGDNKNFIKYLKEQSGKGLDISPLLEFGSKTALATSEEFVDIYKSTVEKNLANNWDVGNLLEWGNKAGIDLGEVFGEKFGANWQRMVDLLDADITEFIKWGEKSGFKVSDIFSDEYIDNFQDYLNSVDGDLDMDAFMAWANTKGLLMGDIFGEKFIEKVNEYLDSANNSINEVSDNINNQIYGPLNEADTLAQRSKLIGPIPLMADGGFLSHGQAVVAEAGPELLEVVNGGVRVTPLTQNSQNTAVNSNAGQKIFYSNYTINATIASSYDVSRLAEALETEKRRIEMGMGKI